MRRASFERRTGETRVYCEIELDGRGNSEVETGVGFFDHMLTLFGRHGLFDVRVRAEGDLEVDAHHTVEDVGIALGEALAQALGSKEGIRRYGEATLPMDEALVSLVCDISGRPFLVYNVDYPVPRVGEFDVELVEEFLRAFASHAGLCIHVNLLYGRNAHHICEAIFKALGRALGDACEISPRISGVLSTKGTLDGKGCLG